MLNSLQSSLKLMMQLPGNLMSKIKGQKKSLSRPSEYECQFCNQVKPLNADNFEVVKTFKYNYATVCRECGKPKQKSEEKD